MVEAGRDLVERQGVKACRSELDRERQTVEAADDLADPSALPVVGREFGGCSASTFQEQPHGGGVGAARRRVERWNDAHVLAGKPQPLP